MFWRQPQRFQTNRKTEGNKTPPEKCNKTLIGQTVLYQIGKPKFGICPERIQILSSKIGHNKSLTYQKVIYTHELFWLPIINSASFKRAQNVFSIL